MALAVHGDAARAVREELCAIMHVLRTYGWLARLHLVQFITHDHWSRVPATWQLQLLQLASAQRMRCHEIEPPEEWPAGLRDLVRASLKCVREIRADFPLMAEARVEIPRSLFCGVRRVRDASAKKRHEIERLAPLVAHIARQCAADIIVDVGCGLGYLSHVLAFHFDLRVIGIDADAANVSTAISRAATISAQRQREARKKAGVRATISFGPQPPQPCQDAKLRGPSRLASSAETSDRRVEGAGGGGAFTALHMRLDRECTLEWLLETVAAHATHAPADWSTNPARSANTTRHDTPEKTEPAVQPQLQLPPNPKPAALLPLLDQQAKPLQPQQHEPHQPHQPNQLSQPCQPEASSHFYQPDQTHRLSPQPQQSQRVLLVGLHTCGDLAATLLRMCAAAANKRASRLPTHTIFKTDVSEPLSTAVSYHGNPCAACGDKRDNGGDGGGGGDGEVLKAGSIAHCTQLVGVVSLGCCYHLLTERGARPPPRFGALNPKLQLGTLGSGAGGGGGGGGGGGVNGGNEGGIGGSCGDGGSSTATLKAHIECDLNPPMGYPLSQACAVLHAGCGSVCTPLHEKGAKCVHSGACVRRSVAAMTCGHGDGDGGGDNGDGSSGCAHSHGRVSRTGDNDCGGLGSGQQEQRAATNLRVLGDSLRCLANLAPARWAVAQTIDETRGSFRHMLHRAILEVKLEQLHARGVLDPDARRDTRSDMRRGDMRRGDSGGGDVVVVVGGVGGGIGIASGSGGSADRGRESCNGVAGAKTALPCDGCDGGDDCSSEDGRYESARSWHGKVGAVAPCASFTEYASAALRKLGLTIDESEASSLASLGDAHAEAEAKFESFVVLRALLSPLVERLLTLDRQMMLVEAGAAHTMLMPLFDPLVSPRNTALVAEL